MTHWQSLPDERWPAPREIAYTALGLGICQHRLGDHGEAKNALRRALGHVERLMEINENTEFSRIHACASRELSSLTTTATSQTQCRW